MSVEVNTILYVGVESIFEALAWGLSGYVALRLLGIPRKYWYMEIPLITLVFVAWQYWTNSYLKSLHISIGNEDFLRFIGTDTSGLFRIDFFDYIFSLLQIFAGYFLIRWLTDRIGVAFTERRRR